ncbi:MAG: thermonuclease family protein [Candidatus Omnitrophota bacterium]
MKKRSPAALILLAAAALAAFLLRPAAVDYNAVRVKAVIDGDTIVLSNNQKVRYIGLDTPEIFLKTETAFEYAPKPFAEAAKEFNRKMVEGKVVRLEFDIERKDKYRRLLVYCFLDGEMVNAQLLRNGLAMLYTQVPNIKYVDLLVKAQQEAREDGLNLWTPERIIPAEKAGEYIGELASVEGRVLKVKSTSSAVYLNFGRDYRTDFSVVIFKDDLRLFNERKIDLEKDYRNRLVRVSGLIKEYHGPEIIVRHPAQMEIIE